MLIMIILKHFHKWSLQYGVFFYVCTVNGASSFILSYQVSNNMVVWALSAVDPQYAEHHKHHGPGVH